MDEKRIAPRISWNFVVKFRHRKEAAAAVWEVSVIQNISKGGCCFFSNNPFPAKDILDLEIRLPALKEPVTFSAEVIRCDPNRNKNLNSYRIGVKFLEMDESKKADFFSCMDFFLKKQS